MSSDRIAGQPARMQQPAIQNQQKTRTQKSNIENLSKEEREAVVGFNALQEANKQGKLGLEQKRVGKALLAQAKALEDKSQVLEEHLKVLQDESQVLHQKSDVLHQKSEVLHQKLHNLHQQYDALHQKSQDLHQQSQFFHEQSKAIDEQLEEKRLALHALRQKNQVAQAQSTQTTTETKKLPEQKLKEVRQNLNKRIFYLNMLEKGLSRQKGESASLTESQTIKALVQNLKSIQERATPTAHPETLMSAFTESESKYLEFMNNINSEIGSEAVQTLIRESCYRHEKIQPALVDKNGKLANIEAQLKAKIQVQLNTQAKPNPNLQTALSTATQLKTSGLSLLAMAENKNSDLVTLNFNFNIFQGNYNAFFAQLQPKK